MKKVGMVMAAGLLSGCSSVHLGVGIPIPGPVKPSVGVTVNESGVKGTGGVGAKAGPVPVCVGGSTKSVKLTDEKK